MMQAKAHGQRSLGGLYPGVPKSQTQLSQHTHSHVHGPTGSSLPPEGEATYPSAPFFCCSRGLAGEMHLDLSPAVIRLHLNLC